MRAADQNLADLVREAARRAPDRVAVVSGAERITWARLDGAVDAVASGLLARGLRPGDRLALLLGNETAFVVGWFGALRAGLVAVPVNTGYTAPEITHQLDDSGARGVLLRPGLRSDLAAAFAAVEQVVEVGDESWAALTSPPAVRPPSAPGGERLAALVYTAGTSGRPRAAMLSHRALLANCDQLRRLSPPPMTSGDVVLLVLPLFHIYGLNAVLGLTAATAATAVLVDRFDPVATLAALPRERVTTVVGAPPMFVAWSMLPQARTAFAGVRLALSGSAPLPVAVSTRFTAQVGRPVHEGYGLTETAPVLTATAFDRDPIPGSVGRPLPGVELALIGADGNPVDEGDPGEVSVRGANLFSGYWPTGEGGPDAGGWFATGDIGYLDTSGELHLVDRRRELILVSGFNVYPREVEDVLAAHPDVAEVAVIGIPHPYTGESVKALVVPVPGVVPSAAELTAFAARSLARFKCPTAIEVVDALPHAAATGKISKGLLRTALGTGRQRP